MPFKGESGVTAFGIEPLLLSSSRNWIIVYICEAMKATVG